jgi:hypothetical protein
MWGRLEGLIENAQPPVSRLGRYPFSPQLVAKMEQRSGVVQDVPVLLQSCMQRQDTEVLRYAR